MSKSEGCPWRMPNYNYGDGVIALHEEINHFYEYMLPTPCEHAARNELVRRVEHLIHALWPQAVVEIFGSFRTGLILPNSDIDLVVLGRWEKLPLRTLQAELVAHGIAEKTTMRVLDTATVPIIKFTDRDTKIKVDISFNMQNGIRSAELVKVLKRDFPGLGKLVLVLKQFLAQRDLNEVFTGGISSYSLSLMCISFLQLHPRDIFHDNVNLGVLLLEFFELYGLRYNYAEIAISIRQGGSYERQQFATKPSPLCIDDPLQPGSDVGRRSYSIVAIKRAFQWAYRTLSEAVNHCESRRRRTSVLGCIIHISDEYIQQRRWLHENFNHLITVE
ncbi:hypothetical protein KR222_007905, partial [Zaprionus bogoriensis]